jgi:hypothetical protein
MRTTHVHVRVVDVHDPAVKGHPLDDQTGGLDLREFGHDRQATFTMRGSARTATPRSAPPELGVS